MLTNPQCHSAALKLVAWINSYLSYNIAAGGHIARCTVGIPECYDLCQARAHRVRQGLGLYSSMRCVKFTKRYGDCACLPAAVFRVPHVPAGLRQERDRVQLYEHGTPRAVSDQPVTAVTYDVPYQKTLRAKATRFKHMEYKAAFTMISLYFASTPSTFVL